MEKGFGNRLKRKVVLVVRRAFFRLVCSDRVLRFLHRDRASMPLGARGELAAERFLLKKGYWIIERSFGEKVGEIDLIVSNGSSVIFVEVKTRSSDFAGDPAEAVDSDKQRHITQTARLFAIKNRLENSSLRFDVVSILWPDVTQPPNITHFQNAFEATGEFQMF